MCIETEFKTKINEEETHKKIEDPTINLRMIILETRINELETILCKLERGKQKEVDSEDEEIRLSNIQPIMRPLSTIS